MCERIIEGRKRKTKNEEDEAMGFGDFVCNIFVDIIMNITISTMVLGWLLRSQKI